MTFTPAITYNTTKVTFSNQFVNGAQWAMRQAFLEAKNFIKSAPEVTVWGGQRFYDRHDIHLHDLFFDDYSGYGAGFDNIDLGFGKLAVAYLGGIRDDIASGYAFNAVVGNNVAQDTTISDPRRSGLYMHTIDVRIHDIDLLGGKLELIADYQFLKGGTYNFSNGQDPIKIGDTSGGRAGVVYYHPFCSPAGASFFNTSYWEIAAIYGYGASELFGVDPLNGKGTFQAYNLNSALGHVNPDGTISSPSLRHASQFRAVGFFVWNVSPCFAIGGEVHYRYDDAGALSVESSALDSLARETGGSSWVVGGGIRPVYWVTDWLALQGQAGVEYVDRNRNGGTAFNPNGTVRNDSFGHSGAMGIFTFAPTIKPKGNWWTRPEFRVYGTYAIWSKRLEGSIGGTPYQNNDQGWVFGVQTEWFF
jgi:maltoporin